MERGLLDDICVFNFRRGIPVRVSLEHDGDGFTERKNVCEACEKSLCAGCETVNGSWLWPATPSKPLGHYRVIAEQGALRAAGEFTLTRASQPSLMVWPNLIGPHDGQVVRGMAVEVALLGFAPHSKVILSLYFSPARAATARYISSFPVTVDASGERTYRLVTTARDTLGFYALRTRPRTDVLWQENRVAFELVRKVT
jgi:hypothetical protein